ncbi:universal stress protein [Halovenus sp. WSH3]|uniref:Universal stress protein n=1 Tax=Halovenus carboxidivorans TaxID=2692199 RepID=A0A6B0T7Z8_9EURY|nr:universal stress protein [Halovenus carboxidivorans]MXR51733.1 universal stress protein [Halovenus carboxidivorans]
MSTRILLPVDRSDHARTACELAVELFDSGTILFLHVIDPAEASFSAETSVPNIPEDWYENQRRRAEERFEDLDSVVESHGLDIEHLIETGKPAATIVEVAGENDIDHIVMGSHGRQGVSRILLGSVAETVVRRSPVPVTVARERSGEE